MDEEADLEKKIPSLQDYDFVFSVLNLSLLRLWRKAFGKLFFMDSVVAWVWKELPESVENAEIYFMQDCSGRKE